MRRARAVAALFATVALAAAAQDVAIEAKPLPLARERVAATSDECAVWRREQSFANAVERHDARAFAAHLHAGAVFNAGSADADRGRESVLQRWAAIIDGKTIALRWRAGIVQIGGEPTIAISRGPYIVQGVRNGAPVFRVGMYQTVWVRDAADGVWRVLFDGSAGASQPVDDRAAADRWVEDQPMSDCAS